MLNDLQVRLAAFAERTMRIKAHCLAEDASRIYLVMPFLELLGYDARDPSTIVPEHEDLVSFAVMVDGRPAIAVEAVGAADPPSNAHQRLRTYCETVGTVKLGIATNGVEFEFFIDTARPNQLDAEPFLRMDLARIAGADLPAETIELLGLMLAPAYNPEAIAEKAFAIDVRERVKACLAEEFRRPSEMFCRFMLEQAGYRNLNANVIEEHFRPILKTAMEQAIVLPVLQAIRQLPPPIPAEAEPAVAVTAQQPPVDAKTARLGAEVAAFNQMKRRRA